MSACRIRRLIPVSLLVLVALCWVAVPARSQDDAAAGGGGTSSPSQDLKALQGRWERPLTGDDDAHEGAARVVKEIKGNRETVTYFDDAGKPVHVTTADFKLQAAGPVNVYTFSNLKVTQGQDKGANPSDQPLSYIYRVDGDLYYEAHGLLTNSPAGSTPSVVRWERTK